jgi:hypothetical protein
MWTTPSVHARGAALRLADTTEGFFKRFDEYRRARVIPSF